MGMKRHHIISNFLLLTTIAILGSCRPIEEYDNDNTGNFEALWAMIDQHYCFLDEKGLDWEEIHDRYGKVVNNSMTRKELFILLSTMLDELKDGHVNLSTPFETSYYRKWWSDYPQNFDERIIEQYYFNFNYKSIGGVMYGNFIQNIGYIRYPSFSYSLGGGNLDYILNSMNMTAGLIIDIRDNGGGDLVNADNLVARFITDKTLAGYISHKTGPGHNDFSEPEPFYVEPPGNGNILWGKPVVVLTNRSTFSAANYFTMIMKSLPNVTIIGATTGGGCGMPISYELPNGWGVRFSACPVYDAAGNLTEFGVAPSPGCEVDMDPIDAFNGHDTILDFAIEYLISKASK